MPLTLSNLVRSKMMNKMVNFFDIAFDSSYAFGGEALTPSTMGLPTGVNELYINSQNGYNFQYDVTNEKLKVFAPAPPIVIEEVQTIASNQITLNYPAAAILNMASATATQLLIEPSDTLAANEVQLAAAMAAGARPTFTFHASTSGAIKTTYITQAWHEVWINRTVSQELTAATHVCDALDTLCFVESMLAAGTTGSSRPMFVRGGDAAATLECEVDWSDSGAGTAGDTTFTFNASDVITGITYTGIKLPVSGFLTDRFIEDEDVTIGSNVGAPAKPILFQAVCGQLADYTAANEEAPHYLMMPQGDDIATAEECRIDWHLKKTLAGQQVAVENASSDAISLTYVYGDMSEIPGLRPLEVKNASNLSELTNVKVMAVSR